MDLARIKKYFPELTDAQVELFSKLPALYSEWNAKINVISRKDIDELLERHILHSLAIAKVITFKPGAKILDAGTGGGFPGIPLAIFFPESDFLLADSIGKKIKVVNEIITALDLKNARAVNVRAEDLEEKFDFVVTRAVADISQLYHWFRNKFDKQRRHKLPNGLICLKGGDLDTELKPFRKKVKIFPISEFFSEEFFETKKVIFLPA
jgi:16S rRNA (guanine527-N7)-methyltransferase